MVWIGVIERVDVPAPIDGELTDPVSAPRHQLPEVGGRGDPSRVATGHADDCDRLARPGAKALVLPVQPIALLQRRAQRLDDVLTRCAHSPPSLRDSPGSP